jgi:hypothetical protein
MNKIHNKYMEFKVSQSSKRKNMSWKEDKDKKSLQDYKIKS